MRNMGAARTRSDCDGDRAMLSWALREFPWRGGMGVTSSTNEQLGDGGNPVCSGDSVGARTRCVPSLTAFRSTTATRYNRAKRRIVIYNRD